MCYKFESSHRKNKEKIKWLASKRFSLKGRILLTKAEGLSHLSYAAQSLYVDKPTCKLIDITLTDVVWKNKCHYMKRSIILNSYNKGGLHFIDFNSLNYAFKINWLNKYLKNQHSIWYIFPQQAFSFVGGITFLLMCNNNISKITVKLSNFHQQVLLSWALIYKHNFLLKLHLLHFLFGIIKIFYIKNRSLFLISGLIMVCF